MQAAEEGHLEVIQLLGKLPELEIDAQDIVRFLRKYL